jgi:multiple sugar transport system substrate-binding protein
MQLRRLIVFLGVAVAVAAMAATAGARIKAAHTITITFWDAYSSDGPEAKTLDNVIIPGFEKTHPGIQVKAVTIPYDDLHQKLITAVAGAQLPDLVRADIIWVPELAKLGVLSPLDKTMPDFKKWAAKVFPGPLATNYYKGHYYGLPLDTNTRILIYNEDTLASIGAGSPPKTFAQFKAMSAKAKAKGLYLYAEIGTSGWNMLPWIWSAGGALTNKTFTKATGYLNSAKSVAAIQMLVDLYKAGEIPDPTAAGGLGTYDGIHQGKYVSMLDGPWAFAILNSQYPSMKLAGSLVPAGEGGSVSVVGGEDIVLTNQSPNKAAALQFLRYMLGYGSQAQMALAGQMPVLKSSAKWLTRVHPYYATFVKQLANARPRTPSPQWPKIDQVLQLQIAKAFKGQESVKQALTEAASQIDALLKQG